MGQNLTNAGLVALAIAVTVPNDGTILAGWFIVLVVLCLLGEKIIKLNGGN